MIHSRGSTGRIIERSWPTALEDHAVGMPGAAAAETFVVAWRRLDQVPVGGDARAWLIGVAYKVLANQRRAEGRRLRLYQRARQATPWAPLPDEQLIRVEDDCEVIGALARLRRIDREIIQLTLWEELAPAEIASVLGISRDAVDQRYSRAKRRLAQQLESEAIGC